MRKRDDLCFLCDSLETYLKHIDGNQEIRVNYANQAVWLEFNEKIIPIREIVSRAKEIGYEIIMPEPGDNVDGLLAENEHLHRLLLKVLV